MRRLNLVLDWMGQHPPFASPHALLVVIALVAGASILSGQDYYRASSASTFVGGSVANPILLPDGTSGAPALAFASEPTLGLWRSAAGTVTVQGALASSGSLRSGGTILVGSGSSLSWGIDAFGSIASPANGVFTLRTNAATIGSEFKADALPTAGTCGTTPAVIAGSTPLSGSVNVGTATPASCIVLFGGTAYPSAPFCTANVVTSTAADTRAIGTLSTTTQVTFTPATAFANSAIVAWHCISSK